MTEQPRVPPDALLAIKKLIDTEDELIARLSMEITADPPLTAARIRAAAYRRCVNIMEETCSTPTSSAR